MSECVVATEDAPDSEEPAKRTVKGTETDTATPTAGESTGTWRGRTWPTPTSGELRPLASRFGPVAVLAAGLVCAGALLTTFASQLWFFADDWEFLLHRGTVAGADEGLLSPHNEHWSTIPILVFRAIFAMVGLREYLPYALPVIAAHLGVVTLMYLLLVRFGTSAWVAVGVALFLAFLGAAAENILWDFQMGLVGSVFFGLLAVWLSARNGKPVRWQTFAVWMAALLALMCQGAGLAMLANLCVYVAAARGLRRALVVASVPAAVYAAWSVGFGWFSPAAGGSAWDYTRLPQYVSIGMTRATELTFAIPGSGGFILAVLIGAALVTRSTPAHLRYFAWAGIAAAVVQFVLSALARIHGDVQDAAASRYAYIVAVLMAPALALVLQLVVDRLASPRWVPTCLVAGLVGLAVVNGVQITHEYWVDRKRQVGATRQLVLGAATLAGRGALVLTSRLDRQANRDVTAELLKSPEIRAALPSETTNPAGLLEAASHIQVGVRRAFLPVPVAGKAELSPVFGTSVSSGGCRDYVVREKEGAFIKLPPTQTGSQIRITAPTDVVTTRLIRGKLESRPTTWPVDRGRRYYVGTSAPNAKLRISFGGGGKVTLCTR